MNAIGYVLESLHSTGSHGFYSLYRHTSYTPPTLIHLSGATLAILNHCITGCESNVIRTRFCLSQTYGNIWKFM